MLKWLPVLVVPWVLGAQPSAAQSVLGPATNLTPGSWSPDINPRISINGSKIAWTPQKGNYDLSYTYDNCRWMNADGTNKTVLYFTAYLSQNERFPSLSADGSKIAVLQTNGSGDTFGGLYVATVDPFAKTQITDLNANPDDTYPVISADGTKVAFLSKRDGGNTLNVWVMKAAVEDSSNIPTQITFFTDYDVTQPAATADGKLLFVKTVSAGVQEIFKVNLDGSGLTQITNLGGTLSYPSQPVAGGKIYFVKTGKDNRTHVFSVNADGSGVHQVTGGQYTEDCASASANNKLVVTIADPNYGAGNTDVYIYDLSADTTAGSVTGKLTTSAGTPQAGATVNAYDGSTLVTSTTTNASGQYSLSLPPGGYTLEFVTANPASYTVTRSVAIVAGGSTTMDAFTTPTAAPRPSGLIATIKSGKPVLRWAKGNAPSGGFAVTGYNIYRAEAEIGPWTKIGTAPATNPLQFTDNAPVSLANSFYKITTATSDGTNSLESAFTDIAQAANNLAFNPSFETVDGNGQPLGWTFGAWGGDGSGGTTTDAKVDGSRSLYILTGATSRGAMMFHNDVKYAVPTQAGVPIVEGMFGKFKDTNTTWPLSLQSAVYNTGQTAAYYWYPGGGGLGGLWDTNGLTNGGGDTDWVWLYNTTGIYRFEFSPFTRLSVFWSNDGNTNLGSSTAYADEVTVQVKRFGATGMVFGRITDDQGNGMAGITVKVGNKSVVTTGSDVWIIPDAPTGDQTLTISVPGKPDYTKQIANYGGYDMQDTYVVTNPGPFTISGKVFLPGGTVPAVGADVRFRKSDGTELTTTVDATGYYTFGSLSDDVTSKDASDIVAHLKGYLSPRLNANFGSAGWSVNNNLTLIRPDQYVECGRTSTAPTIDGHVNTTEWASAQKLNLRYENEAPVTAPQANVYTMWDNNNIYIAFVGDEPNPSGIFQDPNVAIWGAPPYWNGHDMYEFRVDPTNGAGVGLGHEWWQIMNSPAVTYNVEWRRMPFQWGGDRSIPGMEVASWIDTAGLRFCQEVKIPFASLSTSSGMNVETPAVGDEWAVNLSRARHQPEPAGLHSAIGRKLPDPGNSDPGQTDTAAIMRFVTTASALPKGDLNGDRLVNSVDAISSLRIAAGLEWLDGRLLQGDVNNDGKADLVDTVKIIRKINGKDSF